MLATWHCSSTPATWLSSNRSQPGDTTEPFSNSIQPRTSASLWLEATAGLQLPDVVGVPYSEGLSRLRMACSGVLIPAMCGDSSWVADTPFFRLKPSRKCEREGAGMVRPHCSMSRMTSLVMTASSAPGTVSGTSASGSSSASCASLKVRSTALAVAGVAVSVASSAAWCAGLAATNLMMLTAASLASGSQ